MAGRRPDDAGEPLSPGDIYEAKPDLAVGHEQQGRRPVVVFSVAPVGSLVFVAPLTTSRRPWRTRVAIDVNGVASDIMCEQLRAIDISRLATDPIGRAPGAAMGAARSIVAALIGIDEKNPML